MLRAVFLTITKSVLRLYGRNAGERSAENEKSETAQAEQ